MLLLQREELSVAELEPEVVESEIALVMGPVTERLARALWMPALAESDSPGSTKPLGRFHSGFRELVAWQ